ncbi:tetratricopeptide repeat protein, partial [Brachyspira intermedia]
NPNDANNWDWLGDSYNKNGQFKEAQNAYGMALEIEPNNNYYKERFQLNKDNIDKKNNIDNHINQIKEAFNKYKLGRLNKKKYLSIYTKIESNFYSLLYISNLEDNDEYINKLNVLFALIMDSLLFLGRYDEIRSKLKPKEITNIINKNAILYYQAVSSIGKKDIFGINTLEKVEKIYKNNAYYWYWKAEGYVVMDIKNSRYDNEAIKCLLKAVEIESNDSYIWFFLGKLYFKNGNNDDAVTSFLKSIEIFPKHADSWYWLGCCYNSAGIFKSAIEVFNKSLELKDSNWYTWNMLGVAYHNSGNYSYAVDAFNKAIRFAPKKRIYEIKTIIRTLGKYDIDI